MNALNVDYSFLIKEFDAVFVLGNSPGGENNLMRFLLSQGLTGMFFCMAAMSLTRGQAIQSATARQLSETEATSSPRSGPTISKPASKSFSAQQQATLLAYRKEQSALGTEYRALTASGASTEQIQKWIKSNAVRFQTQAQRAQAITLVSEAHPIVAGGTLRVPAGASAAASTYVSNQTALSRSFVGPRRKALLSASAQAQVADEKVTALTTRSLVEQNASLLNQQRELATSLAAISAEHKLAPSNSVRNGADPKMRSFLSTRNQLAQKFAQFQSRYATANVATRTAAMTQWRRENAALLLQYQTQAGELATAASTPAKAQ